MLPEKLLCHPKIVEVQQALREGKNLLMEGLWDSPKAAVVSLAQKVTGKHILIITGSGKEENRLYHDLHSFCEGQIVDFPAWETLPNENIAPGPDVVGTRYDIIKTIIDIKTPLVILGNLQAYLQKLIPKERFNDLYLQLTAGDSFGLDMLVMHLEEMGYFKSGVAADKGEFAVRGGIVDVFPVSTPDPYRIEFWGDTIESIRTYDPIGQKSIQKVDSASITPALEKEFLDGSEHLSTILDYLGENVIVIFDDLLTLEDRYTALISVCGKPTKSFAGIEEFMETISDRQSIYWSNESIEQLTEITIKDKLSGGYYSSTTPLHRIAFTMFNRQPEAYRWNDPFIPVAPYVMPDVTDPKGEDLLRALSKYANSDFTIDLLCQNEQEQTYFKKKIEELGLNLTNVAEHRIGYLSGGFVLDGSKYILFPFTEVTHRYKIRRQKQRSTYHTTPAESFDLIPGDVVVHLNNGIGKYLGIETRPNNMGITTEYMIIEYADKARLYVPLSQSYLVSKYIGVSEEVPRYNQLGNPKWKKLKEQTEQAIRGYATDLLKMYAEREIRGGFAYPKDSLDVLAFEEEFPFVETEDQLRAVDEIKKDMTSNQAMDRLVCGDVGYGKTEVAMRAAFKAVVDGGKQVAVLVPTTVLAMQHYDSFKERMGNYPVNVAVISRFQTTKQIRETLEGIASGSIDILIGTHRIVSKDVKFKDLGLVVIDEEQRFGVKAKEHLKKIKTGVDCITLSATPIPRTLYMSLIGVKDMSVINTPPQDRLPITTIISEASDDVLKNALLRELTRDGQAFVIHNRVESIFSLADRIKTLLPQARVLVGHGQMDADELDMVFHAFKNGTADILVSTTIIESGIDIPNANTILIDRSDQFGLADLYQLRGRVGRWVRRAFAYFLVNNLKNLSEVARKRLHALAEASGYGGGMKIAMRDLEIRGAGDILGMEQSGHVSAIGFHFYCKLLKRMILSLQGKISPLLTDTKLDFPIDARLPDDYVNDTSLRMEIYQRLGEASTWEEVSGIWSELKDRFGPPPQPVLWLYHVTRIRVYASRLGFVSVRWEKNSVLTELKKGQTSTVKKAPLGQVSSPQDMENKVIQILKTHADQGQKN